jgi:tetratricopeptide (TPR) repeat protein
MSEALYERYKDALRRGHVAALRGRFDAALVAYGEAADIAPERALPHASLGTVLSRLERHDEALVAFGLALERAPRDETALAGRADILAARGQRVEAAETLDRLAETLDAVGRLADSCDAARRALELAESRERRRLVRSLVDRLRASPADAAAIAALEGALGVLGPSRRRPDPDPGPEVIPDAPESAGSAFGEPELEPAPTIEPAPERPGGVRLALDAEERLDVGDRTGARDGWLAAAMAHRADGQLDAALDACYLALALAPDDAGLHLTLAEIYLDRGWRGHAAEKLALLATLVDLEDDRASRARLCELAAAHFADDERLAAICA